MKKLRMNKFALAATLLISGLALSASVAQAAGSFDPDPLSFGTGILSSAISPQAVMGHSDVTNAQPGDTVSLNIYYHNSGNQTINNVRIRFSPSSTGQTTSQTFTGTLTGDGAATLTDTTLVNISSAQTLTFIPGSVRWFPNQSGATNPNGQTISASQEADLVGGNGFNIGALSPGWSSQGGIVAKFKVGSGTTQNGQMPTVSTYPATNVINSTGTVTLNGVFTANGSSTTTYFQYRMVGSGSWITVGQTTQGVNNLPFAYTLTGLSTGNYEFQAFAQNAYGTAQGSILPFTISNNLTPYCPSGQYWNGSACVTNIPTCPSGQYWNGSSCVTTVQTCGYNQYWNGSYCVNITQTCPSGQYWNGSYCVTNTQTCGYNQYWNGSYCVNNVQTNTAPNVSTLGTVSVGATVAVIDGYYNVNGCSISTSFQYGTTQNLGNSTTEVNRGSGSGSMAQSISGLSPNTTYYYRATGRNCVSTAQGDILSFKTGTNTVVDTTINTNVTNIGIGGNSFIKLMIDNHRQTVSGGRDISYDVSWENLTTRTLKNLVLEVNFPTQMSVIDTDHGSLERNKNSVVYQIDSLGSRESGSMVITTNVGGNLREGDPVVAQAIMAFENPKTSATENAIGYDADTFSTTGSVLRASLFGLGFLPTSLIGWLIILLIIILIIILARHYMNQGRNNAVVHVNAQPGSQVVTPPAPQTGAPTQDYIVYRPNPKQ